MKFFLMEINKSFILEEYDLLNILNQLKTYYLNSPELFKQFFEKQSSELLLSEAQLLDLLGLLESFNHEDKKTWVYNIYDQLAVKSNQWGYWSFVYAVDLDRSNNTQKAVYFYKRALESIDLTTRQRGLSRLRLSQLESI